MGIQTDERPWHRDRAHVCARGGAAVDLTKYDGHGAYRRNTAQAAECRESPAGEKALGLYLDE